MVSGMGNLLQICISSHLKIIYREFFPTSFSSLSLGKIRAFLFKFIYFICLVLEPQFVDKSFGYRWWSYTFWEVTGWFRLTLAFWGNLVDKALFLYFMLASQVFSQNEQCSLLSCKLYSQVPFVFGTDNWNTE